MHGEPPRAAPSAGENRGHRRFEAPLLPVSRPMAACRMNSRLATFSFHGEPYALIGVWKASLGCVGGLHTCE